MIIAIVRFDVSAPLSAEAAEERFAKSAPTYQDVSGLRRKHFLRSADGRTAGGVYVWENTAAADAYHTLAWRQGIAAKFGSQPWVEYFEVPVVVDPESIMTGDSAATATRVIAASPSTVFAAITDITRIGEFSPETGSAEWLGDSDKPEVGARYMGHNRLGDKAWSIECEIVELVADERFVFDCLSPNSGKAFARWTYEIEPVDGGCRVTESFEDYRPLDSRDRGAQISGVSDRVTHNRAGMIETLSRLAAAVE